MVRRGYRSVRGAPGLLREARNDRGGEVKQPTMDFMARKRNGPCPPA